MKKIIATEKVFGVLGDIKEVILHYENGTKKTKVQGEKRNPEMTKEILNYVIENFNQERKKY